MFIYSNDCVDLRGRKPGDLIACVAEGGFLCFLIFDCIVSEDLIYELLPLIILN